jgi:hypothetical protein
MENVLTLKMVVGMFLFFPQFSPPQPGPADLGPPLLSFFFPFPLLLKPATQKLKKIWSTLIWSSRRAIVTGQLPVELWYLSAVLLSRVFDLVFCKILFGDKYYILWH